MIAKVAILNNVAKKSIASEFFSVTPLSRDKVFIRNKFSLIWTASQFSSQELANLFDLVGLNSQVKCINN